ncbi:MAG: hypothetical protein WCL08_11110 [Verrucomicrobiota bacterium]
MTNPSTPPPSWWWTGMAAAVFLFANSAFSAEEASPGGARRALNRAEQLQKNLNSADPSELRDSLNEATQLMPSMEAMVALLKVSEEKIAGIRAEFEKKAENASRQTAAFYQNELKTMKDREADLADMRVKMETMVRELKAKVEKAKKDPEVQALLQQDDLLRRSNETLDKLKKLKLPSLEP